MLILPMLIFMSIGSHTLPEDFDSFSQDDWQGHLGTAHFAFRVIILVAV